MLQRENALMISCVVDMRVASQTDERNLISTGTSCRCRQELVSEICWKFEIIHLYT